MTNQLIFPMGIYVFFMWASGIFMFLTRLNSVRSGKVAIKYFRALMGEPPPEKVVVVGRHYDNQFQLPILFFITCLLQIQIGSVSGLTVAMAWGFVLSRWIHSYVLLGANRVQTRVIVFGTGWFFVLLLWVQILVFAVRSS